MQHNIMRLKPKAAHDLILGALTGAGTSAANARYLSDAILDTELSGLEGHGFYWLQYYCAHVKCGKVKGKAKPVVKRLSPVSFMVDTKQGFAHPAIEKGFARLIPAAQKYGIAAVGISKSYSGATLGYHTGVLAKAGLVAFGFTNAMPAMAPVGGRKPVLGTNPLSFAVPGAKGKIAFLIDQSSTAVTWTALKRAAEANTPIPMGWALDEDGAPTTDPHQGLAGSMAPAGGTRGFGQSLMVEVMCAALGQSLLGTQMNSFTDNDGKSIGCGQFFIAISPKMFAPGSFDKQIKALTKSITSQPGARMPNSRRVENQKRLRREGIAIEAELYATLKSFCK